MNRFEMRHPDPPPILLPRRDLPHRAAVFPRDVRIGSVPQQELERLEILLL